VSAEAGDWSGSCVYVSGNEADIFVTGWRYSVISVALDVKLDCRPTVSAWIPMQTKARLIIYQVQLLMTVLAGYTQMKSGGSGNFIVLVVIIHMAIFIVQ